MLATGWIPESELPNGNSIVPPIVGGELNPTYYLEGGIHYINVVLATCANKPSRYLKQI